MNLVQLIYVSKLANKNEMVIGAIHDSAVRHNTRNGLTGMLLYRDGSFMQVLEGPRDRVLVTYNRIQLDPRHTHHELILEEPLSARNFPSWSMGLCHLLNSEVSKYAEFGPYLQDGFDVGQIRAQPGVALSILKTFGRGAV